MQIKINLQNASGNKKIPKKADFKHWLKTVFSAATAPVEISIRIVDPTEMHFLNNYYRGKNKPTNILSFPFIAPPGITTNLLGDLVICANQVTMEAKEQNKSSQEHWAHLTIHGALHLLGYTHDSKKNANSMENLEIQHLKKLGYANPYAK